MKRSLHGGAAAVLSVLTLVASGCTDGSKLDGVLAEGITTSVSPETVAAGAAAHVTCQLVNPDPIVADATTTYTVTPGEALTIDGAQVSTTVAGTYHVVCSAPELQLTDPEGATLVVVAGPAVAISPVFDENPIEAGQATGVRCAGVDQYGNPVSANGTPVGAAPLVFSNGQVSSEVAGEFEVTCDVADTSLPVTPATLTVTAGQGVAVELRADPERAAYPVGVTVRLYWVIVDNFGNEVSGAPGTLTAPTDADVVLVDATDHRYKLGAEGRYTFNVVLDAPLEHLTDDLELIVDEQPPVLTITWPPRGQTLIGTGGPLTVTGNIRDTWSGIAFFEINGDTVSVAPNGDFSHDVDPVWGVNLIHAVAEDGGGHAVKLTPTYQYTSEYLPYVDTDAEGVKHGDGMVAYLGQNFLDDGVHDHSKLDDVATLLEVVLGDLGVGDLIDDALSGFGQTIPIVNVDTVVPIIPDITWLEITLNGDLDITAGATAATGVGPTRVDIDSRAGGLDLDLTIGAGAPNALDIGVDFGISADLTLSIFVCSPVGCAPAYSGGAFGNATATSAMALDDLVLKVHTDIAKTVNGPLQVNFRDFDFQLVGLDLDPIQDIVINVGTVNIPGVGNQTLTFRLSDLVDLNSLIGGVIDPIFDALLGALPLVINPLVETLAGPVISALFEAFEIDLPIELPALFGEREEAFFIELYTKLSTVAFTDPGGRISLATGIYADKGIDREPEGSILRKGCLTGQSETLTWAWDPSIGLGVRTDVVNAFLFGAWWTGWLNGPLDLATLTGGAIPLPIDNIELEMTWLLPPTVNDCDKSNLRLQVGDLFVVLKGEIAGKPVSADVYADLSLAVSFVPSTDGLSIRLGQLQFSDFEVIDVEQGDLPVDLRAIVEEGLTPLLGQFLVGQEFGPIAIPGLDLSDSIPGVPPGTTLGIGNLSVRDESGYVVVGGDLQ